ncbi:hypothetical protein [Hwangdonia lutea]|uniref:Uncharacterized protein n=1 Tax=Hwangdonia lutea TaxID=3075823 RepID=A0AA97EM77_9FLAO|nr:hypothetical protein [Hwangdonia sp. SCSIO 19198]WOD43521.1 hypothetical protein RNZ46_16150 [Hwangdonia sp. SCSIO 19198]
MKTIISLFKKETLWLLLTVTCFLGTTHGKAQINCTLVESYGNASKAEIIQDINNIVAGQVWDVGATNLKKLEIKEVKNISFKGCRVTLELKVKLKRKVRRNAKGTIIVSGTVYDAQFYGNKHIKIKNASVDKVRLSKTLRLGERFYKWVANKVFPSNHEFPI